jgi:uncharacterized membrane protein YkvA (DUF1232 family)
VKAFRGLSPRTGAKHTVMQQLALLPKYLKLLMGLFTDRRVGALDKLLVGAAAAYILLPADLVPDWIPFLGEVDDLYFLTLALQRLIANAGRRVIMSHWEGSVADLADLNIRRTLAAAAFFLPGRIRGKLRRKAGRFARAG